MAGKKSLDYTVLVDDYLHQNGWKAKANSNSNYSFSGLVLHTMGSVLANYALTNIYSKEAREAQDHGWMYGRAFEDLDGHIWEIFYMDESKMPEGKGIHTEAFHSCVVNYLKKGFSYDEAAKRCMGGLGRNKAVKKSHWR